MSVQVIQPTSRRIISKKSSNSDSEISKHLSFGIIFVVIFLAYVSYLIYNLSTLFSLPKCKQKEECLTPYLNTNPQLNLLIFTSTSQRPTNWEVSHVFSKRKFDVYHSQEFPLLLDIPEKVRRNGTMYMHIFLTTGYDEVFNNLQYSNAKQVKTIFKLTDYMVPKTMAFQLLGQGTNEKEKKKNFNTVTHLKSRVTFNVMTEDIDISIGETPLELVNSIKLATEYMYMPMLNYDFLQTRRSHLIPLEKNNRKMNVTVIYAPTSMGKLRLTLQFKAVLLQMKSLGFSNEDLDEMKSIFADTNLYLLGGIVFIAAMHLCFDFLAFKNDIHFWRIRKNLTGLSTRTVVWRAFSQIVIFLFLIDKGSSMLVVIPTGIGVLIEIWKTKKILKAEIVFNGGIFPRIRFNSNQCSSEEAKTREFDAESIRYLKYLFYPLIVIGAVYSLLYEPHKSWYSWCLNSLVNGVYAFGFLFMLPQLFINYKLKSVAHLPWKAFMYKAFNTFIDDIFAFIITMPTAHRVACFRDDAVFLVYLYQRWLYPVDKNRLDSLSMDDEPVTVETSKKKFQ